MDGREGVLAAHLRSGARATSDGTVRWRPKGEVVGVEIVVVL